MWKCKVCNETIENIVDYHVTYNFGPLYYILTNGELTGPGSFELDAEKVCFCGPLCVHKYHFEDENGTYYK